MRRPRPRGRFKVRYGTSTCALCEQPIRVDSWARHLGNGIAHLACWEDRTKEGEVRVPDPLPEGVLTDAERQARLDELKATALPAMGEAAARRLDRK